MISHPAKVVAVALFAGVMWYLVSGYPLNSELDPSAAPRAVLWAHGAGVGLAAAVATYHWLKLRTPSTFPQLIVMIFVFGDLAIWCVAIVGRGSEILERWPIVRVLVILELGTCLGLYIWKWRTRGLRT